MISFLRKYRKKNLIKNKNKHWNFFSNFFLVKNEII